MGRSCRIDTSNNCKSLVIGENARIGDYVHINADYSIEIGDNVLMASKIFISDANHGNYNGEDQSAPDENPTIRKLFCSSVKIGNNVWIGENVIILPGTIIGDGCIVGANSVVNGKAFPSDCIIAGAPAKIVKKYNHNLKCWEKI